MRTLSIWLLSLVLFDVNLVQAQQQQGFFEPTLTLHADTDRTTGTTVYSQARAVLYGPHGARIYKQVIVGHQITDINLQRPVGEARYVSPTGDASGTLFITGIFYHCYDTAIGMHANDINLHDSIAIGPVCADIHWEPPPRPDPPDENCPVLLDLDQNGFHLSGPDPAVSFDIDADGVRDRIAWTRADDDDAFLCMDRNHNGVIDDGRELFGYATLLQNGQPAQVGYRALAELDSPGAGGNSDGKVDTHDQSYHSLCAWTDANRDGVSQANEIQGLEESGVVALSYNYRTTGLRDAYGNLFRYVSRADMRVPAGTVRSWPTFDVIFVGQ